MAAKRRKRKAHKPKNLAKSLRRGLHGAVNKLLDHGERLSGPDAAKVDRSFVTIRKVADKL
jgi:hypothetical protein